MSPTSFTLVDRRNMPAKKNGGKKSSPTNELKPAKTMESEIVVQDPLDSPEQEHAAPEVSRTKPKNLMDVVDEEEDTPFTRAEDHLYKALLELQKFYEVACKTNAVKVTMELTAFISIATKIQDGWEEMQAARRAYEESLILKSVKHIQASITGLERKYEDMQAKIMENNAEMNNAEKIFNK